MATVLAISSKVARGSVGLNAIVPALRAFGHDVIELPTVWLSNHPGHGRVAGRRVDVALLRDMLDAIESHGWLAEVDAVLTGYLPSAEHVAFAAETVTRTRNAALRAGAGGVSYWCDPVIGDDPKGIYIDPLAAAAIRDILVPLADVVTPNRFELEYLASRTRPVRIAGLADVWACRFGRTVIVAKSVPTDDPMIIANTFGSREGQLFVRIAKRDGVPHGTGDFYGAALLGAHLRDRSRSDIGFGLATRMVACVIERSQGRSDLDLTGVDTTVGPAVVEPRPVTVSTIVSDMIGDREYVHAKQVPSEADE